MIYGFWHSLFVVAWSKYQGLIPYFLNTQHENMLHHLMDYWGDNNSTISMVNVCRCVLQTKGQHMICYHDWCQKWVTLILFCSKGKFQGLATVLELRRLSALTLRCEPPGFWPLFLTHERFRWSAKQCFVKLSCVPKGNIHTRTHRKLS